MPLRPGEEAKLAPDEEERLLTKLRFEREAKASAQLQLADMPHNAEATA